MHMSKMSERFKPNLLFLLFGFFACIQLFSFCLILSDEPQFYITGLCIIWLAFIGAILIIDKQVNAPLDAIPSQGIWFVIFLFSILFRLLALDSPPFLEDDYQRYLFDGKLLLSGINPYQVVPLGLPELGGANIPKPDIKTIYPPLAQGLFALSAWLGGELIHWRMMNLIPDLLGAWVFLMILRQFKLPSLWLIAWLWNPLIIKEGLHSAHLDIWTLFTVILFVYLAHKKQIKLAALSLSAAILIKLIPVLLLPMWLIRLDNARNRILAMVLTCLVVLVGFSLFFPYHPFFNIANFMQHIQGYGVLFAYLNMILGSDLSKWLLISMVGAGYLFLVFIMKRYRFNSEILMLEIFALFFLFSSMGFPWYLLLSLPLILLTLINTGNYYLLFLCALFQIHYYAHQVHQESPLWPILILIVLLLCLRKYKGINHA